MKSIDRNLLEANNSNSGRRRNEESRSFTQGDSTKESQAMSNYDYMNLIVERIETARTDITADEEDWTNIIFGLCTTFGENGRQFAHRISQFWYKAGKSYCAADVDDKYDYCLTHGRQKITVATVIDIARDYGIDVSMPPGYYPEGGTPPAKMSAKKTTRNAKEKGNVVDQVATFLRELVELRYNTITENIEVRNKQGHTQWVPISERTRDTLYTKAHEAGIKVTKSNLESYLQSEQLSPNYNPFEEYIYGLHEWRPSMPDYIDAFFSNLIFDNTDELDHIRRKFIKMWFCNLVALMLGRIKDNQLMPNLIGKQNVGKSFFCQNILPPSLRDYCHTVNPNDSLDKDLRLSLSKYALIVLEEFKMNKKDSNAIKALISSGKSEIRAAYARYEKSRERKASFIANGNDEIYISDRSGARRFISCKVNQTLNLNEHPLPYEGAYAQALYLISQCEFRHSLTQEEVAELDLLNEAHFEPDLVQDAILKSYRKPLLGEIGIKVSSADIFQEISFNLNGYKPSLSEIGKAMNTLGFEVKRPKNKASYYVIKVQSADYDDRCKQEGIEIHNELMKMKEEEDETRKTELNPDIKFD